MLRFLLVPIGLNIVKRIGVASQVRGSRSKTPDHELGLQAGDRVRVKSKEEIAATLDRGGRNRGLEFTPLMHHCCGRAFTVRQRVERMILEASGEMRELKNTVMLESATCDGRVFFGGCPRNELHFWREAWLERLEQPEPSLARQNGG
jgi:hypothetical protein